MDERRISPESAMAYVAFRQAELAIEGLRSAEDNAKRAVDRALNTLPRVTDDDLERLGALRQKFRREMGWDEQPGGPIHQELPRFDFAEAVRRNNNGYMPHDNHTVEGHGTASTTEGV